MCVLGSGTARWYFGAAPGFGTFEPRGRQRPEAKTPAKRGLSRRPDRARAGLCRARAHESGLSPRASKAKLHGAGRKPRFRPAEFRLSACEPAGLARWYAHYTRLRVKAVVTL